MQKKTLPWSESTTSIVHKIIYLFRWRNLSNPNGENIRLLHADKRDERERLSAFFPLQRASDQKMSLSNYSFFRWMWAARSFSNPFSRYLSFFLLLISWVDVKSHIWDFMISLRKFFLLLKAFWASLGAGMECRCEISISIRAITGHQSWEQVALFRWRRLRKINLQAQISWGCGEDFFLLVGFRRDCVNRHRLCSNLSQLPYRIRQTRIY